MKRNEFPKRVRLEAFQRANGKCEKCTARLAVGRYHFDHVLADTLGGKPSLDNCAVLCVNCHKRKTVTVDIPLVGKSNRVRSKFLGLGRKKKSVVPGSKASKFKKKLDGTVVIRGTTTLDSD